jgi:hypothetical protein
MGRLRPLARREGVELALLGFLDVDVFLDNDRKNELPGLQTSACDVSLLPRFPKFRVQSFTTAIV